MPPPRDSTLVIPKNRPFTVFGGSSGSGAATSAASQGSRPARTSGGYYAMQAQMLASTAAVRPMAAPSVAASSDMDTDTERASEPRCLA